MYFFLKKTVCVCTCIDTIICLHSTSTQMHVCVARANTFNKKTPCVRMRACTRTRAHNHNHAHTYTTHTHTQTHTHKHTHTHTPLGKRVQGSNNLPLAAPLAMALRALPQLPPGSLLPSEYVCLYTYIRVTSSLSPPIPYITSSPLCLLRVFTS